MPQIDEHLKWCLKDTKRLVKTKPDLNLAKKHVKKSEYNYGIVQTLEKLSIYDWAFNVGFLSWLAQDKTTTGLLRAKYLNPDNHSYGDGI